MIRMAITKTIAAALATIIVTTAVTVPLLPKAQGEPLAASTQPAAPVTRVTGTVKDAETGKAIEKFRVMPGSPGSANVIRHISYWDAKECERGH